MLRIENAGTAETSMRKIILAGVSVLALATALDAAQAQSSDRMLTGAVVGAGTGALVFGPPGAVIGGVLGASVGGPRLLRRNQECWYDRAGMRHCRLL